MAPQGGPTSASGALKAQAALAALENLGRLKKAWGIYGLRDGINLGKSPSPQDDWFSPTYYAIDLGPLLIGIENYRTGLVWHLTSRNPWLKAALPKAFSTAP